MELNTVERDFIDFIAKRQHKTLEDVQEIYIDTKTAFKFETVAFKALVLKIYDLNRLVYDDVSEADLISTYKYHELITMFRFLSYTFTNQPVPGTMKSKCGTLFSLVLRGDFKNIFFYTFRTLKASIRKEGNSKEPNTHEKLAEYLRGTCGHQVKSVVDYGCGPAYVSFAIAQGHKNKGLSVPTTYLIDIDCLTRDFALYRFEKYKLPVKVIDVNTDDMYPCLPDHDICIASEVMEHIKEPLRTFNNINAELRRGGVLYGNFANHAPHMLHISPDLNDLRTALSDNQYSQISANTYSKQ